MTRPLGGLLQMQLKPKRYNVLGAQVMHTNIPTDDMTI